MATLAAPLGKSAPRLEPMRRYLLAMVIGALLMFATLAAALVFLPGFFMKMVCLFCIATFYVAMQY